VELKDSDRLRTRLLAINLRVVELDHELQRTQLRVQHLEAQLEDARLARMVGGDAGNPAEIGPELERSRGQLESQRELLDQVKKSQWKARVACAMQSMKERRAEREPGGAE
jgi:hypothetical protein